MDIWMVGLPASVALAAVALLGYIFGQRTKPAPSDPVQLRRELKRARSIIRDLEKVAQQVRRDLARHQGSLGKFRTRLRYLCDAGDQEPIDLLASETDKMLEPTQQLTARLTHAYEMIRRQADQLMTFSAARTDELTGLGNRRALEETLASQIEMQHQCGIVSSLAMFDIDLFQHLNQEQGRGRGDIVLKQIGQVLDQYARDSDVVCRYGGEEFVVVLPGTGSSGAIAFAERMRLTIERLSPVTVSCGVAEAAPDDDAMTWLARADAALYSAKSAGRNRVFLHNGITAASLLPTSETPDLDRRTDEAARETIRNVAQTLRDHQLIKPRNCETAAT